MAEMDTTELSPHYYRDNFLRLCDTVEAQYADILAPSERLFLRQFRRLDFHSQCLYVRLVSRVGPWFRESKLVYPELGELTPLVDRLLARGLLQQADALCVDELGRLYTRDELGQVFRDGLAGGRLPAKGALLAAIDDLALEPDELLQCMCALDSGRVITPLGVEEVALLQLLFFGNRRQSLTEFVLSDLGVARYYPYELDRSVRLFEHRPALDEYLFCAAWSDTWYELREQGDGDGLLQLADDILATAIACPSSINRRDRLCNGLGRDLERMGELELALTLYQCSGRHPARERSARILERSEDWPACISLCEEMMAAPWCEQESEAAGRILPRARRKLDGSRSSRARDTFEQSRLQISRSEGSVELQVAVHLAPRWAGVHYVENRLMNTLFGLAFWEQIFAPVPGAFHNPFQAVPADMYEPAFRQRRQKLLAERLAELRSSDLESLLLDAYSRYHGYQCHWVDWRLEPTLLQQAAKLVPPDHLLAIWERILFDPRENRAGFPDLIALGDSPGDYCMIEVKAPGDALQDSQRRWLRFFQGRDIPAEVAWVEWQ